jgi:hypothetical protein
VVFIHNGILLSHEEEWYLIFASKWIELESIMISKVSQAQKANEQHVPSYADYRPKINAVILFDMGHI